MELNGKPFVPPTCPTEQSGGPMTLSPDQFGLIVHDAKDHNTESFLVTEFLGYFAEIGNADDEDEVENTVETGVAEASIGSDVSRQAYETLSSKQAVHHMGELFCERVLNCRGVIDGECWALGARAVIEVVQEMGKA